MKKVSLDRGVRLLEATPRPPATDIERLVVAALKRGGAMDFRALVDRVASDLYHDELRHGGWAVDIGVFGRNLFVSDVVREIEAGNGLLWRIEDPDLARILLPPRLI